MSTVSLRNTCVIQTSWNVVENKDITDAVVYRFEDEDDENRSPVCPCGLHLRAPHAVGVPQGNETSQSEAHCTVTVSQAHKGDSCAVSAIDVLCSAKFMELYSERSEYLCTSEGVRIDGEVEVSGLDDDQRLFCLQHSFDIPVTSFMLKFLGLTERDKLWLHSLHITVARCATGSGHSVASLVSSTMGTGVDWEKVRELTSDVSGEIPEKARQLWESVEAAQKKRESSVSPLEAMLGADCGAPGMPPMVAAMMSMFAGMNTSRQSRNHPKVNAASVSMTTGNETETRRSNTMGGAVSEVTTGNGHIGQTLANDLSHHGNVTHKTFTSEVSNSAATVLTTNLHSSAGTITTHRDSAGAPLNSAGINDGASAPLNSAGTGDSASSTNAVMATSCVHCMERQTRDWGELEERLNRYVSEVETRIVTVLGKRVDDAQQKTQDKLDAILRHLTQRPSPRNDGATDNSITLD